jgi:hypothetical protein
MTECSCDMVMHSWKMLQYQGLDITSVFKSNRYFADDGKIKKRF